MKDYDVLTEQLKLMASKIMDEGKNIPREPLVIDYDNGGGQSGIRENPFYIAYEKLLASYTKTLTAAKAVSDGNDAEIVNLDAIRSKFKVAK